MQLVDVLQLVDLDDLADLLARDFLGSRLFPMSAPIGGTLLIAGWLAIAVSALWRFRP